MRDLYSNDLDGAARMAEHDALPDPRDYEPDDYDRELECEGHESTDGPIGNVVFCDGTCKPRRIAVPLADADFLFGTADPIDGIEDAF